MGSKQLTFQVSSWGFMPGTALAVGGMLVVVMIMAMTAICLMCYYWGMLLKKTLYEGAPPLPPPSPPPPLNFPSPSQVAPSDYKVFVTAEPSYSACLPSTVVLMPGEDMPTFLALPCDPSCTEVNLQDDNETKQGIANMEAKEVKVEVSNQIHAPS